MGEHTGFCLNAVYVSAVKRSGDKQPQLQPNVQVPKAGCTSSCFFLPYGPSKKHFAFTEKHKLKPCHQRNFIRDSWTLVDLPTCRPKRAAALVIRGHCFGFKQDDELHVPVPTKSQREQTGGIPSTEN